MGQHNVRVCYSDIERGTYLDGCSAQMTEDFSIVEKFALGGEPASPGLATLHPGALIKSREWKEIVKKEAWEVGQLQKENSAPRRW